MASDSSNASDEGSSRGTRTRLEALAPRRFPPQGQAWSSSVQSLAVAERGVAAAQKKENLTTCPGSAPVTSFPPVIGVDAMARAKAHDLTDAQWAILGELIPKPKRRDDRRGRPWKDCRAVLNGVLWVLRTGTPWADVPERYPSYQTCHRRFQQWVRSGVMKGILEALALDLRTRGILDVREAFIDGSFAPAKKGGQKSGRQSAAREQKSWLWQTAMVSPVRSLSKVPHLMK